MISSCRGRGICVSTLIRPGKRVVARFFSSAGKEAKTQPKIIHKYSKQAWETFPPMKSSHMLQLPGYFNEGDILEWENHRSSFTTGTITSSEVSLSEYLEQNVQPGTAAPDATMSFSGPLGENNFKVRDILDSPLYIQKSNSANDSRRAKAQANSKDPNSRFCVKKGIIFYYPIKLLLLEDSIKRSERQNSREMIMDAHMDYANGAIHEHHQNDPHKSLFAMNLMLKHGVDKSLPPSIFASGDGKSLYFVKEFPKIIQEILTKNRELFEIAWAASIQQGTGLITPLQIAEWLKAYKPENEKKYLGFELAYAAHAFLMSNSSHFSLVRNLSGAFQALPTGPEVARTLNTSVQSHVKPVDLDDVEPSIESVAPATPPRSFNPYFVSLGHKIKRALDLFNQDVKQGLVDPNSDQATRLARYFPTPLTSNDNLIIQGLFDYMLADSWERVNHPFVSAYYRCLFYPLGERDVNQLDMAMKLGLIPQYFDRFNHYVNRRSRDLISKAEATFVSSPRATEIISDLNLVKQELPSMKKNEEGKLSASVITESIDQKYPYLLMDERIDFGNLPAYAIDDATAKEIDDAVSIERLSPTLVRVHVHIADPTSFERRVGDFTTYSEFLKLKKAKMSTKPAEFTSFEEIARHRITSVYEKLGFDPMLPKEFTSHYSLASGASNLCLTVSYDLSIFNPNSGKTFEDLTDEYLIRDDRTEPAVHIVEGSRKVCVSVVRNLKRITYLRVDELLTFANDPEKVQSLKFNSDELEALGDLKLLFNTASGLYWDRITIGKALEHNYTFPDPIVSEDGLKTGKIPVFGDPGNFSPSRILVSELMIRANHTSGTLAYENGKLPFYYRVQPDFHDSYEFIKNASFSPEEFLMVKRDIFEGWAGGAPLEANWDALIAKNTNTFNMGRKVACIVNNFNAVTSGTMSMSPELHTSLGLKGYSWVTSPLRRYADWVNHFQMKGGIIAPRSKQDRLIMKSDDARESLARVKVWTNFTRNLDNINNRYWIMKGLTMRVPVGQSIALECIIISEFSVQAPTFSSSLYRDADKSEPPTVQLKLFVPSLGLYGKTSVPESTSTKGDAMSPFSKCNNVYTPGSLVTLYWTNTFNFSHYLAGENSFLTLTPEP